MQAMVRTLPRVLRRELVESIQRLEGVLEMSGFAGITWLDALRRYRAVAAPGGIHAAAGLLPEGVLELAREVDRAFGRIYAFKPEDYLSEPLVELVENKNQKKASDSAAEQRKIKAQAGQDYRRPMIENAIRQLVKTKKIRLESLNLSDVRDRVEKMWPIEKNPEPKRSPKSYPSKTTLNRDIAAVIADLKKTDQSSG